ncbi:MAG: hypothetical protein ACRCZF_06680, partial [Gemmataceae bacterium]
MLVTVLSLNRHGPNVSSPPLSTLLRLPPWAVAFVWQAAFAGFLALGGVGDRVVMVAIDRPLRLAAAGLN